MKFFNHKLLKYFIISITVFLFLNTGCKKKDEPAPDIPPKSTFVMDLSDFSSSDKSILADSSNWGFAALNVGFQNIVITVNLIVPVAAFVECLNHEAEYHPDDETWTWSFSFVAGSATYTAELLADLVNDQVHWEMRISKSNSFSNYLWYEGDSKVNRTEGTWTLYRDTVTPNVPTNSIPFVGILWHRNTSDGTCDIKYTNIIPNGPENGGYITYGITNQTPYDAFYDIFNKGQVNLTEIEWNRTNKDGRVRDSLHFGDTNWHCWDTTLVNDTCE